MSVQMRREKGLKQYIESSACAMVNDVSISQTRSLLCA